MLITNEAVEICLRVVQIVIVALFEFEFCYYCAAGKLIKRAELCRKSQIWQQFVANVQKYCENERGKKGIHKKCQRVLLLSISGKSGVKYGKRARRQRACLNFKCWLLFSLHSWHFVWRLSCPICWHYCVMARLIIINRSTSRNTHTFVKYLYKVFNIFTFPT